MPVAARGSGAAPSDADVAFGVVKAIADARALYLYVDLGRGVDGITQRDTWEVLIDADGRSATGASVFGLDGVDARLAFSPQPGQPRGWMTRFDAATRAFKPDALPDAFDAAPAWGASQVEIRIARSAALLSAAHAHLRVVDTRNGHLLDTAPTIDVMLPAIDPGAPATTMTLTDQPSDPLARTPGTDLRVVTWNTLGLGKGPRRPLFTKMLAALDADIVMLEEMGNAEGAAPVLMPAPAAGARPWRVFYRDEFLVGARGFGDLTEVLDRPWLPSATGFYDSLNEIIYGRDRAQAVGIRTASRHVLVVALHLPCCGEVNGRRASASAIQDAVRHASAGARDDAVIVGGDFNLMWERGPLDTIRDAAASPLATVEPLRLSGISNATWRGPRNPTVRFDYILYSGTSLQPLRSFVFETDELAPEWLRAHGLDARDSDASRTSDHLPVVADFRWRR